jgi:SAM-dependent methyltransferase
MPDTYTHGHHDSVLRSHRWRTAANSAGYLLERLEPGMSLLDVGCGPGSITVDLAQRLAPGGVVGMDRSEAVLAEADEARMQAESAGHLAAGQVTFAVGDVYHLDFEPESFDVVHAHQVLQHLSDPVAALRSMATVLRPGGTIAARDSDYRAFNWYPDDPRLDRWLEVYRAVCRHNGAEPDAGRRLLGWAQQAGLGDIRYSSSTWTFADPPARAWWGGLWAERVEQSDLARQAVDYGLATTADLADMAEGFRHWAEVDDATFIVVSGEILAHPA